ncbi:FAD/NAD(P)-binding domain-containing protein [Sporormia fimetaria CBS 119925]|uniref:FAD/NAD(P)-binding domain-containing protein n=1 Tax=Sporormia fimetaria CBS 119925 TaxID=1340428 RepID=A0A6A6VIZ4_9PLEO|nr:FAD/NAD(P)-binding domain-containing protein [Sporormia fimetaria CBS 119925]
MNTADSVPSKDRVERGSANLAPFHNFPPTSTSEAVDANKVAQDLISAFNDALKRKDHSAVAGLFLKDNSFWRDHLSLNWQLRTLQGRSKITEYLSASRNALTSIEIDSSSAVKLPQVGPIDAWGDVKGIQSFIKFETEIGRGEGVVRLAEADGEWKIFTLYTFIKELKGHEEPVGQRRPQGVQHGDHQDPRNWLERRETEKNFENNDPTVLVIGAGQSGLTVGARLKMLGIRTLIIDKNARVGDNWRKRYHSLVLHDPVWYDHMPYLPFPSNWPIFTPKDKLASFFEAYVELLELNVWTSTTLSSPTWSDAQNHWTVTLSTTQNGVTETRTFNPRHMILATGHSGKPNIPSIPGTSDFRGPLNHSSTFTHPSPLPPNTPQKRAVVIGSCNSAHDISQSYHSAGYHVTLLQRSTTCVVSSSSITELGLKGLYDESGPPVDDADVILWGTPMSVFKTQQIKLTKVQKEADAEILEGLGKVGFQLDDGPGDAGLLFKYFQRGGGYYIDVGASRMIAEGKINVKHGSVDRMLAQGVRLKDGTEVSADEIVLATGYRNMRSTAREIFGDEVADRLGEDVWGLNEEGEFREMWQRTRQRGFWYMGGNLALVRFYSRVLALQVKGLEEGLYT